mmetsp:Transcript_542/g.1283  ORF Transcript_542/g.1283 Transcript_542/m.1283 type:complete len:217 (+) Transcript_542:158-808(+)
MSGSRLVDRVLTQPTEESAVLMTTFATAHICGGRGPSAASQEADATASATRLQAEVRSSSRSAISPRCSAGTGGGRSDRKRAREQVARGRPAEARRASGSCAAPRLGCAASSCVRLICALISSCASLWMPSWVLLSGWHTLPRRGHGPWSRPFTLVTTQHSLSALGAPGRSLVRHTVTSNGQPTFCEVRSRCMAGLSWRAVLRGMPLCLHWMRTRL